MIPNPCRNCESRTYDCKITCKRWKIYESLHIRYNEIKDIEKKQDQAIRSSHYSEREIGERFKSFRQRKVRAR